MRRRDFISLIGGAAAAWPLSACAQQADRVRVIGATTSLSEDDPEDKARSAAFRHSLQELGWTVGGNVRIEYRYGSGNAERIRKNAAELVALAPDVILVTGTPSLEPLLRETRTVPIVFVQVPDPVGAGFVESLSRPGGNATGFMLFEYSISGKWLELLKQIAPAVTRVAVFGDPDTPTDPAQFGVIQAVAPSLRVEVSAFNKRDANEIERAVTAFAASPNGGLILTAGGPALVHRDLIISLAARHKLPAVYFDRAFVAGGGLLSYGPDRIDLYRRAAGYVDRILKGEKPADMPVQAPTATADGRRSDRITMLFAAPHGSACGPSRRFAAAQQFSRFRSEGDIQRAALTEPDL